MKKSQNCVKAEIAFVCTTSMRKLLFALLQLIAFVCTSAIKNIFGSRGVGEVSIPMFWHAVSPKTALLSDFNPI